MADRHPRPLPPAAQSDGCGGGATLLRLLHNRAPNSAQVVGFLTLIVSAAILLILTGLTVTAGVTALVIFAPVILLTSPLWIPAAAAALVAAAGLAGMAALGVGATWAYRYWKGREPVGSDRVDYARRRIAETAREVKDYAGFPRRTKDAAPGA